MRGHQGRVTVTSLGWQSRHRDISNL